MLLRSLLEYDTTWSEPKLNMYRHAWHLLQETSPELFGRRFAHLSPWLRRVISELAQTRLSFTSTEDNSVAYARPELSQRCRTGSTLGHLISEMRTISAPMPFNKHII